MIIKHRDLINISDDKVYHIEALHIEVNEFLVKEINNAKGYVTFYYDDYEKLMLEYNIECDIVVPSTLTPDFVFYHDIFNEVEEVAFNEIDEGFFVKDLSNDEDFVKSVVIPNIPLKAPDRAKPYKEKK